MAEVLTLFLFLSIYLFIFFNTRSACICVASVILSLKTLSKIPDLGQTQCSMLH